MYFTFNKNAVHFHILLAMSCTEASSSCSNLLYLEIKWALFAVYLTPM